MTRSKSNVKLSFNFSFYSSYRFIKFYPEQENPNLWVFHFFLDDFAYSGGNSQLNIELPFTTWVKQSYDGRELIIMAEAIMHSDLYDQSGTMQFPFKMTYKIVTHDNHSGSNEISPSVGTSDGLFDEIDRSDSIDSASVSSAPVEFTDFVMHGSPFKVHENLILENCELKKDNDLHKNVIAFLELRISDLKFREDQHKQSTLVLEKENANLQVMNFCLQAELKKIKVQQEMSVHTLKMEKNNLETNIQTLKSEMKKLETQRMLDKKTIGEHTLKCEIGYFDCKSEQHKLLGLELQSCKKENENLNSMIINLESEMKKLKPLQNQQHEQLILRNQQLEVEKKAMNFLIYKQSFEIGTLTAIIITKRISTQNFEINLREIESRFDDFINLNLVSLGHS